MMTQTSAVTLDKHKIAKYMFKGDKVVNTMYKEIIGAPLKIPNLQPALMKVSTNVKRIEVVDIFLSGNKIKKNLKSLDGVLRKNDRVAKVLRKKSEVLENDTQTAMRCLNLALLLASKDGAQIGTIYAQRGIEFYFIRESESCLRDIEFARQCNIDDNVKKLLVKLFKAISDYAENNPDNGKNILGAKEIADRKLYQEDVLFKVYGPEHPKIPVTANYIAVKYNKEKGRFLVSNMDLPTGTTIIVENPYVSVLDGTLNWNTQHCGKCYKKSFSLIPCPNCVFVMYCDDKCCQDDFKNAHKYECHCLPFLHSLRTLSSYHLALKAVCKVGPTELYKMFNDSLKPLSTAPLISGEMKGFNPKTGIYEKDSYYAITKLAAHLEADELPPRACISLALAQVLQLKTDFFTSVNQGTNKRFVNFVASHILTHATTFPINSFGLSQNNPTSGPSALFAKDNRHGKNCVEVIHAVYPFISLVSHSCAPNCVCENLPDGRMAVVTNREIKLEEELTITYGFWFWMHDFKYRKSNLKHHYFFTCQCIACVCDWPLIDKILSEALDFICPHCSKEFSYNQIAHTKMCVLIPMMNGFGKCPTCHCDINLGRLKEAVEHQDDVYKMACHLIKKNKPLRAIPLLHGCIKVYQHSLCPPSSRRLAASDQLENAQALLA